MGQLHFRLWAKVSLDGLPQVPIVVVFRYLFFWALDHFLIWIQVWGHCCALPTYVELLWSKAGHWTTLWLLIGLNWMWRERKIRGCFVLSDRFSSCFGRRCVLVVKGEALFSRKGTAVENGLGQLFCAPDWEKQVFTGYRKRNGITFPNQFSFLKK